MTPSCESADRPYKAIVALLTFQGRYSRTEQKPCNDEKAPGPTPFEDGPGALCHPGWFRLGRVVTTCQVSGHEGLAH